MYGPAQTAHSAAPVSRMSPDIEAELLLACARSQVTTGRAADIPSIAQKKIDWERLLRLAKRHGGIPILYQALSTTCRQVVPPTVLDQLRDQYQALVQHNHALTERLLALLGLLQAENLPVLTFKGPEMAIVAYHDPTLRPFGDIDLLVEVQDVARASALLGSQGYQLKAECDWQLFFAKERGLGVDLHWKLGPEWLPPPGNFKDMWGRARQVAVGSTAVRSLATEDLLLVLAMLLTRDIMTRRQRLIQICDAAALLRNLPSIDWRSVLELSRNTGARRMLLFQVALAHTVLGLDLPPEMATSVRGDTMAHRLARQIGASLFAEADRQWDPSQSRPGPGFAGHSFLLQSLERPGDKAHYLRVVTPGLLRLAVSPTARDREFLPLPELFRSLYFLVRPVRLLWRLLRTGYLILD